MELQAWTIGTTKDTDLKKCTEVNYNVSNFVLTLTQYSLDHAVKLHGRMYHFLQPTSRRGDLQYLTFDASEQKLAHANSLKTTGTRNQQYRRTYDWISLALYNEQLTYTIRWFRKFAR